MKKNLIIGLISCWASFAIGQSLSNSVICSFGKTDTSNTGEILIATFGQCPGCGTLTGPDGSTFSQGFPNSVIDDDEDNDDCSALAEFEFDEVASICGTSFSFFYIGWGDTDVATFNWDFGANAFPQTSSDPNPTDVTFGSIGMQNITLTVIFEDCDISSSNDLNAQGLGFGVNANIEAITCDGQSDGRIDLELSNGTAPFSISWSNGETTDFIANLEIGDYAYTVVDAQGCEITNTVAVPGPSDPLTINFITTKVSCGDAADGGLLSEITGGTGNYTYSWSNSSSTVSIDNLDIGQYSLTVTDENGCITESTTFVGEACRPTVYNTISPNGDNLNDVWIIEDISDFPDNEMKIYNRWGSLIYEEAGYNNDWTGTDNGGNPLLSGAYYYVLHLNNPENTVLTGSLTLVR